MKLKYFVLILLASLFLTTGVPAGLVHADQNNVSVKDIKDEPIDTYQKELLNFAFETTAMIPVKPHIKDRCRALQKVVETALELNQAKRALEYIGAINNWRKGECYAGLAFYCAERGYNANALRFIKLADAISEDAEDWRKDRITAKTSETRAIISKPELTGLLATSSGEAGKGLFTVERASIVNEEDLFFDQILHLDNLLESGNFDMVRNSLKGHTALFNNYYENDDFRNLIEEKIKFSWNKMPVFIRFELLLDLAGIALDHQDYAKAFELVNEAQLYIDTAKWSPEYKIKFESELIAKRFLSGDKSRARTDARALRSYYNFQRVKIVNIYRAGTLRPLAEVYHLMGDTGTALSLYKQTIAEGIENPNSRPRAEDLASTCLSMALHGAKPDNELWIRIGQIKNTLSNPW